MSLSKLARFVLPPLIASATVFSAMTIPLAFMGDKQIGIKFQEEPFFSGKLRDVATPYIVLSTALSLGAGISVAACIGWQLASRKEAEVEQQLSILEQHLQQKDELLNELKLSEYRLQVSGLHKFLDDELPAEQVQTKSSPTTTPQPVKVQTPVQVTQVSANSVLTPPAKQNTNVPVTSVAAASTFASAQSFLGYSHTNTSSLEEIVPVKEAHKTFITPSEFEELQHQFRQMMLQMQAMQNNLQLLPQVAQTQAKESDTFSIYYDFPNTNEV